MQYISSEPSRRALHEQFLLPTKRPMFKKENRFSFQSACSENGPLVNPHETLKNTKNGKFYLKALRLNFF